MKRLVPIMAAALALTACGASREEHNNNAPANGHESAEATGPIVQLPVLAGRPGAGYFTIDVPADHGALLAVSSPQIGRIEMHETMRQGSMSSMRAVERLAPENGRLVLARGGRHLMLFEVSPQLVVGGRAQLVLRFEHGQTRTLDAAVVDAANHDATH